MRPGGSSSSFSSASSTPGRERLARGRVVADRQQLSLAAEDHLLVRDEAGQPDGVDDRVAADQVGGRRAVPDGASFFASLCSSMISARGK